MNTRINNLPTGTLSDSDYIPFDGSGGTKKVAGSLITNKADKVSSVTTGDLASLTSAGDLADSGYKGAYFGGLGNAIGMRGWNQIINKSNFDSTKTEAGITFTNNGDGTVTANGTCTGSLAIFTVMPTTSVMVSGHKYIILGCPANGSLSTYILSSSSGSFKDVGGGSIFTFDGVSDVVYIIVYSNTTVSNLVFKPQLIDLTALFGAGSEPSTVAEFRAMFPADYYPYHSNTNCLDSLNFTVISTWT